MNIIVLGAGQVGTTIVEALHDEHDVTVIDVDANRLQALSYRYDVRTVTGNGATRRILQDAEIGKAALMIACTSRDEINLVAAMLAKKLPSAPPSGPGEGSTGRSSADRFGRRASRPSRRWRASSGASAPSCRAETRRSCPATASSSSAPPLRRRHGAGSWPGASARS